MTTEVYYMIRHKASGTFMPLLKRNRGYSHWNPSTEAFLCEKAVGVPRLLWGRKQALKVIVQWNAVPNGQQTYHYSDEGSDVGDIKILPDGRSKDDLEVVEVKLTYEDKVDDSKLRDSETVK